MCVCEDRLCVCVWAYALMYVIRHIALFTTRHGTSARIPTGSGPKAMAHGCAQIWPVSQTHTNMQTLHKRTQIRAF